MSALITGVHRAYPFAVVDSDVMNTQVETMYKIAHLSTFNIAIHAFMLLFQVMIFIFVFVCLKDGDSGNDLHLRVNHLTESR